MIVCGLQIGSEPSACIFQDGKLIWYNEERKIVRRKLLMGPPYACIEQILNLNIKIDLVTVSSYNYDEIELFNLKSYLVFKKIISLDTEVFSWHTPHHVNHLFKAYVDSGFDKARVFVIDGRGSDWYLEDKSQGYETASVFDVDKNNVKCIYKNVFCRNAKQNIKVNVNFSHNYNKNKIKKIYPPLIDNKTIFKISNKYELGNYYGAVSKKFGFDNEEGKFMGLQSYGKVNINLDVSKIENIDLNVDHAASCQKYFEESYLNLIKKFKFKNMVFTGGTGLNVVNNFKLKKHFTDSSLYFEPLCGDEGNSIGSVYSYLYSKKQPIIKLDNIYLGQKININKNFKIKEKSIEINEIINLLKDGEVVGLIQGRAEAGPRALGNRSLLLDPTIPNCKDIMNEIKKREKFRPFAISIIEEVVNDYFDFKNIDKSPFMMYAPQAKDKAKNVIPGILHVDNTCRVQTVNKKDNFVLYKLLQNFKVPMLMNTSFNLAGYPMVDSFEDVVFSLKNSKLKYIYFADEGKLLSK